MAALKMELRESMEGKPSESELETRARATQKWRDFRKEQFEMLREAGRKQIQYENAKRRWETARSALSLKKMEMERL